eukprot:5999906-Ditylum_brightwellii.AAC.1
MTTPVKKEATPNAATSSDRKQGPRMERFKGNCKALSGVIFDLTNPRAADKFKPSVKKFALYISVNIKYGTHLKWGIKTLEAVSIVKPDKPDDDADDVDKSIYAEQIKEYVRCIYAIEDASKQAYALVWGQCFMPMRERIHSNNNYALFLDKEDVIELLKAIKSSVFKFKEDNDLYMSTG